MSVDAVAARPPRLARNAGANMAFDVTSALAGVVVTPVLLDRLGVAAFGLWVLAGSVVGYLELFELGFGRATTKLVAEDAGRRPEAVVRTLNTNLFVLAGFGALALVVGLVVAAAAPSLFDVPDGLRGDAVVVFAVLTLSLAASVPLDAIGAALAGHQRHDLLSAANGGAVLVIAAANVAVVVAGGGVVALAVTGCTLTVLAQGVRWQLLRRVAPGMRLSPSLVDRRAVATTARLSGWFLGRDLARTVIHRVDLVVVGAALGVRAVAVYAVASKLATPARRLTASLARLYFPYASALAGDPSRGSWSAVVVGSSRTTLLVGAPIAIVLAVLGGDGIEAWVGDGFGDAVRVLGILAAASAVFALTEPWWALLMGAGHHRPVAVVTLGEAVLNVVLSVALAGPLGLPGVALGTLLAVALVEVPAGLVLVARHGDVRLPALWRGALRPHLAPAAVATAVALGLAHAAPPDVLPVLGGSAATVAAYLVTWGLLSATPEERAAATGALRRRRAG